MKRLGTGKYLYRGHVLKNHGYYPPDRAIAWEATDLVSGQVVNRATSRSALKGLLDDELGEPRANPLPKTTTAIP